ncbi:MAG: type III-B CRISPR module RAMP protein Cmr6, partial [Lentisphaerae bacterium]
MNWPVMHDKVRDVWNKIGKKCHNWTLYFDKFIDATQKNVNELKAVIANYNASDELPDISDELPDIEVIRQLAIDSRIRMFNAMAEAQPDTVKLLFLRNTSRLIVQMARPNPLENTGVSFEKITGLPMVRGTAVKGSVSTYATWKANGTLIFRDPENIETDRKRLDDGILAEIFGANAGDAAAGKVVFYGLFPLSNPCLELDILTPHPAPSGDLREKVNPHVFLAIGAGTFWLCPLRLVRDARVELLEYAAELIAEALRDNGLGAKTAAGYGRFELVDPETTPELQELWNREKERSARLRAEKENRKREEEARKREEEAR